MKVFFKRFSVLFLSGALLSCSKTPTAEQAETANTSADTTQTNISANAKPTTTSSATSEIIKDDVQLIGWSKDGKILVYRAFALSEAIARHSYISVEVVNLVDDKVIWSFSKNWQEDNVGEGSEAEPSPLSGEEAWEKVSNDVLPTLEGYNLDYASELSANDSYDAFPFTTDDGSFEVDVQATEEEARIDIVKDGIARKKIYEKKFEPGMIVETEVPGCFINPKRNRIAVIVREYNFSMNQNFYSVTGCLLSSGF